MKQKTYIGCSGYYYNEWKEIFYPAGLPKNKWFGHYCTKFNTLEINSSFYRIPTLISLEKWYAESPSDFVFTIKAFKGITHFKKFVNCKNEIESFYALVQNGLKEKLGCILFQCPPSLHFSYEKLNTIISSLSIPYKNVIEFRHKSWFIPQIFEAFNKNNIIFCGQSYPADIPETAIITSPTAYYRFHGKPVLYKSRYDIPQLKQIAEQLKNAPEKFIYFNNTWGESALHNAQEMQDIIL